MNISISDKLNERIQSLKGEINVSAICREAIEKALEFVEPVNETDAIKVANRIVTEKTHKFKNWFSFGFEHGIKDAETKLSYEDFMELEKGVIPDYVDYRLCELCLNKDCDREAVEKGYEQGCLKIWNSIKDEVKEKVSIALKETIESYEKGISDEPKNYKFIERDTEEWHEMWEDLINKIRSQFPNDWKDILKVIKYQGCGRDGYHVFVLKDYITQTGEQIAAMPIEVPDRRNPPY